MWIPTAILFALTLPALLVAQDLPNPDFRDTAVIPYFHELNPEIVYFQTLFRSQVDPQHTLLLVRGGDPSRGRHPSAPDATYRLLAERDLLGLFLQSTADTSQVWKLTVQDRGESYGGSLAVDRADSGSIVLKLTGAYGVRWPFLKFFYELSSRQFLGQTRFKPVAFTDQFFQVVQEPSGRPSGRRYFIAESQDGPVLVRWETGPVLVDAQEQQAALAYQAEHPQWPPEWDSPYLPGSSYRAEYARPSITLFPLNPPSADEIGSFHVWLRVAWGRRLAEGVAERTTDGLRLFPFPKSTLQDHARLRPEWAAFQRQPFGGTIAEEIGPYLIDPGRPAHLRTGDSRPPRFWFAKNFYDGEGLSGVGAVGYFDTELKEYVMYSPPELAPWSASSLFLGMNNTFWLGLVRQPEGAAYSGGLLHFDPRTGNARVYDVKEVIHLITYVGDGQQAVLATGTANGIYLVRNDRLERFVLEPDREGRYRLIAAPPPLE